MVPVEKLSEEEKVRRVRRRKTVSYPATQPFSAHRSAAGAAAAQLSSSAACQKTAALQRRSPCPILYPRIFFGGGFLLGGRCASWPLVFFWGASCLVGFPPLVPFFWGGAIFWGPWCTGTLRVAEGMKEGTDLGVSGMGDIAKDVRMGITLSRSLAKHLAKCQCETSSMPKWHAYSNRLLGLVR